MAEKNIFEYASRNKLRFATDRGLLQVENLWDMPLRSKDNFNLDAVAKRMSRELKETTEESFVDNERPEKTTRLEIALEIVKHVIKCKLDDESASKTRAERRQKKAKLLEILEEKQNGALSTLTIEQLQQQIKELDS